MMVTCGPVRDRARLEALFAASGMVMPPFGFGMEIGVGGDRGCALFRIDPGADCIYMLAAEAPTAALADAALRAGVAAGEQMGCRFTAVAPEAPPEAARRLAALGYTPEAVAMGDFFGPCRAPDINLP